MGRFLVSWVAGGLVVLGAWFGWAHPGSVSTAMAGATDLVPTRTVGPTPSASPQGTVCPVPGPRSAEAMNGLVARLDDEPMLQGADHGGSVALADGRRLFTFGDTIRDTDVVRPFMVRNSLLVTDGSCLHPVTGDDDGAVVPDDGETGFWPMSLRATPSGDGTTMQVIVSSVRSTGGDDLEDFETTGSDLVTFDVPTGQMPELVSRVPLGPRTTDPRVPTWGAAMWDDGPWTYVFGTASTADKSTAGWSLHVARTRPESLGTPSAWQYWDGSDWVPGTSSDAAEEAARLIGPDHGVSHALSVIERDGSWYAISKEGDYHGDWLTVWTSPSVTGPYTPHRVRPLGNDDETLRYAVLAHPDLAASSGRLIVSWSESPTSRQRFVTQPRSYRPRFAEIDLP